MQSPTRESGSEPPPAPPVDGVTLDAACAPAQVVERLAQASRRGKLPGFQAGPGAGEFRVRLMGEPFDREIQGRAEPRGDAASAVSLRERVMPLWPVVAALFSAVAIWPGVWLTDSMLETYWPWLTHRVATWWWYIPLTAIPLPFALRTMWRKSSAAAAEQREKAMRAIRDAIAT